MSLLRMSLSGAVMILLVTAVRALAIHRLPKKAFLALWGIVLARLLIPYSLPSALSVYSLLKRFAPAASGAAGIAPGLWSAPAAPAQNAAAAPAAPAVSATAAPVDPWIAVWLAGALACAAFFALSYLRFRREFRASLPVDNEYARRWSAGHRLRRGIELRQSDRISAPLTYGVLRPIILMPKTTDWDDAETLNYVLAHEYVHIRRFDAAAKLILTLALCVHWFDPAVWMMYVLANRDIELSCDEAVIRRFRFGEGTRSAYAMALIRMEETRSGFKAAAASAPLCSNFSKNAIEERITAIMKIKKTSMAALFAAVALVAGMTTAFATSANPDDTAPDPVDTAIQVSTTVSYVDSQTGLIYYSLDGGISYESMTAGEYAARFPKPEIEWWTYEEYKAWLENEKTALQDLIGERAWTSGRGEFVWTQELVDETVAAYERVLEAIKNGTLYSKMVNGGAEGIVLSMVPGNIGEFVENTGDSLSEMDPKTEELLELYVPFGLSYRIHPITGELSMSWQGEPVHSVYDAELGVWIANDLNGSELGPDAERDLEAIYEEGELIGLRLIPRR